MYKDSQQGARLRLFYVYCVEKILSYLSRELGITVASLTKWRDKFLMAGIEAMKKKPLDEKDREVVRLREKVGEITFGQ